MREKKKGSVYSHNRVDWNIRAIAEKHGQKAAKELLREFKSK